MPSEFEHALTQLNRLESGQRRLQRRVTRLTIVVVGQGVLLSYLLFPVGRLGIPKYVEANWFVLVDGNGRVRGEWIEDNGPHPRLFTEKGEERALLYVNHDNDAGVMLSDKHPGSGRWALLYAHDKETGVRLYEPSGAQAGFELSDRKSGLQTIDEPPPTPKP